MIPKGIENANAIIEACKLTLAGLDSADPEWKEVLQSVIEIMEDLKTKFFLKTNLAIPITNASRKDATELQSLVEKHDLSCFPEVLARFRGNMEKLLKQAKMEGVIIT
ncbi:MAG: hypothetical protein E3J42_01435 [Dehalococcoidia bacterium]|nr:MAG: hypothetical protein E3J42_01435 [Dehalococcoidia bacterium]